MRVKRVLRRRELASDKVVRSCLYQKKLIAGQTYVEQLSLDDEQGNKTVNPKMPHTDGCLRQTVSHYRAL